MKSFKRLGPVGLKLCTLYDAFVIGSSAKVLALDQHQVPITDIDIVVSPDKWVLACKLIPLSAKANEYGGFKFIDGEVETDVWAGDAALTLMASPTRDRVNYLWSPKYSGYLRFGTPGECKAKPTEGVFTPVPSTYPGLDVDWEVS